MDGIYARFVEGRGFGSGLELSPVVYYLGEVSHALKGSCDFATKVRRESREDWVIVGYTASD